MKRGAVASAGHTACNRESLSHSTKRPGSTRMSRKRCFDAASTKLMAPPSDK